MFKKVLSSLGFGCATIDTILRDQDVVAGQPLHAELQIRGGETEQDIQAVTVELVTDCRVEITENASERGEVVVASSRVEIGRIGANEERTIPLQLDVPAGAPVSDGTTESELRTRLEILGGVDPRDADRIKILPSRVVAEVLVAMKKAGFLLAETEVKHRPDHPHPVVQEFDFRPAPETESGVDDLELSFFPKEGGADVLIVADCRGEIGASPAGRSTRFSVMEDEILRLDLVAKIRAAIAEIEQEA